MGLAALPETVGFTTDYRGSASTFSLHLAAFNQPHWIVAHEVSHQWWGLQLLPGNAPGWQFLTEGLAEYSAWREYQNDKLPDL
ncbi:M1 family metallopeptidase, partial [Salmonella sp. gx-f4]|nr:M1 family metallopeptidase [Salmonella sp. gx-f4]